MHAPSELKLISHARKTSGIQDSLYCHSVKQQICKAEQQQSTVKLKT